MNIDFILNIDWAMYIDWLLRILQISTFIGVILKISFQNKAYINNIEIQVIKTNRIWFLTYEISSYIWV